MYRNIYIKKPNIHQYPSNKALYIIELPTYLKTSSSYAKNYLDLGSITNKKN